MFEISNYYYFYNVESWTLMDRPYLLYINMTNYNNMID
jgi:hypothetical protein